MTLKELIEARHPFSVPCSKSSYLPKGKAVWAGVIQKDDHGERCGQAKLTREDIARAKKMYRSGYSFKKLGEVFHVSRTTIQRAVRGQSWRHLLCH